mmetsp:Transcript_15839/g.44407  ORF Transcript_15839/g.44407 Transcript_15839/m.44407 type:complete len:302 (-) Transcript_15839:494-1399(-)
MTASTTSRTVVNMTEASASSTKIQASQTTTMRRSSPISASAAVRRARRPPASRCPPTSLCPSTCRTARGRLRRLRPRCRTIPRARRRCWLTTKPPTATAIPETKMATMTMTTTATSSQSQVPPPPRLRALHLLHHHHRRLQQAKLAASAAATVNSRRSAPSSDTTGRRRARRPSSCSATTRARQRSCQPETGSCIPPNPPCQTLLLERPPLLKHPPTVPQPLIPPQVENLKLLPPAMGTHARSRTRRDRAVANGSRRCSRNCPEDPSFQETRTHPRQPCAWTRHRPAIQCAGIPRNDLTDP